MDITTPDATRIRKLARPELACLAAYNAGLAAHVIRQRYGIAQIAKLASNENPLGPSRSVWTALQTCGVTLYPDGSAEMLRAEIERHTGIKREQIIIGNGSEEIIQMLCTAFLSPGDRVVTALPGFGLHDTYPKMMGASVSHVLMSPELEFDVPAWLDALQQPCKLLIFSNPSNPVGCRLDTAAFERVIQGTPPDTLIVVDEAYFEYAKGDEFPDSLAILAAQQRPWIVLRTFSKAYGLAGLRVGYGLACDSELIAMLDKVRTPFNVNVHAQAAAVAAINDVAHVELSRRTTEAERTRVATALRALRLRVAESHTNFLFFDIGAPNSEAFAFLLQQGVIVKAWRDAGFESYIRVTIGSPSENDQFLAAIRKFVDTPKGAAPAA